MIPVLIVGVGVVWAAVAFAGAIAVGMTIAAADGSEQKSCCPHPEADAPETVRGQFRAVVVPR